MQWVFDLLGIDAEHIPAVDVINVCIAILLGLHDKLREKTREKDKDAVGL